VSDATDEASVGGRWLDWWRAAVAVVETIDDMSLGRALSDLGAGSDGGLTVAEWTTAKR